MTLKQGQTPPKYCGAAPGLHKKASIPTEPAIIFLLVESLAFDENKQTKPHSTVRHDKAKRSSPVRPRPPEGMSSSGPPGLWARPSCLRSLPEPQGAREQEEAGELCCRRTRVRIPYLKGEA